MTKNVKILGTTYNGVDTLNAKEAGSEGVVKFVETSDANAGAEDIKRDKTAYVNGQKVVGTSDAIVPEGAYDLTIRDVVDQTSHNVANYETVTVQVLDSDDHYLDAGSHYHVMNGYLYKEQWPDVPSEGYYYFYSTAHPIEYPSSEGIYNATKDGEYSYHFNTVSNGYYQIKNNSISELGTEPVYFLYNDGQEIDEILLYHSSNTPRSDLVTDGKALKISYIEQNDHYEYKTITTYPQADGNYTYTATTDTFVAGGGGGPSTPGLYSYKNGTLSEVTSSWLMNFGSGEYTDLGSNTTYYLYNSNGPAAMLLPLQRTYYMASGDFPQALDDGLWVLGSTSPEHPEVGHYYVGTDYLNDIPTYPQADGNYTYTSDTDSFTPAQGPSGTLSVNANGYNDTFDVTNYAAVDITITTEDGSELYPDTFYVSGGSGITTPNRGVYLVFDSSGNYKSENIVDINVDGVFAFKYEYGGSTSYLEEITDGHYIISDGEANIIDTYPDSDGTYNYTAETDSFTTAPPAPSGTLEETLDGNNGHFDVASYEYIDISLVDKDGNPIEDGKVYLMGGSGIDYLTNQILLIGADGSYSTIQAGAWEIQADEWGYQPIEIQDGYNRIVNGVVTDYLDPGAYVLATDGPTAIDGAASGVYFIDGTSFTGVDEGYYSIGSNNQMPQVITNSLIAFYDQGQTDNLTDMTVGSEQTITLVTGHQYKITRLN